jgi:ribosomal protein S18 acetylase RimI-like enzyme
MNPSEPVRPIPHERVDEVVDVLAEAFHDYPVMCFVLGEAQPYPALLQRLVAYFVAARYSRGETVLGTGPSGGLTGVALISRPGPGAMPPELERMRQALWEELGDGARSRYERFGAAASVFVVDRSHLHLNMIGVRSTAMGSGLGRRLLDHVHARSAADPASTGVSLSTEVPGNVELYRHFGYEVIGEVRVDDAFTSWGMFRPDP